MIGTIFSMMTERDFWDMFHSKHNPKYHAKRKKQIRQINTYGAETKVKIKQNVKFPYSRYKIDWCDIVTEGRLG